MLEDELVDMGIVSWELKIWLGGGGKKFMTTMDAGNLT